MLFFGICLGQREKIASLEKLLLVLKDTSRIDCLNELSDEYSEIQIDSTEIFALQAIAEAQKIKYYQGLAEAITIKSTVAFGKYSDYPGAEKFAREAIYLFRQTPNKRRLNRSYFKLGQALYAQSDFKEAINNFDTSSDLSKKAGDTSYILRSATNSAASYLESGDYKKAFEKIQDLHQLELRYNYTKWNSYEWRFMVELYFNIGDFNKALKYKRQHFQKLKPTYYSDLLGFAELFSVITQFDSARYYYSLVDTTSEKRALRFYLVSIGEYYFLRGEYSMALPNLLRGLLYHRQVNDRNQLMRALVDIAKTYHALQNNDSAFKYADEALGMGSKTGARQIIKDAYKILSLIYYNRQRFDSAYYYYRKYTAMNDSILNDQVKGKIAGYDFEQKIELLSKEKEIQQIQLQKQSFQKNILITGIIVFLFVAFLLWRNNRHKQKANSLLQQQKEKVETTLSQLKSTQKQLIQSEKMASLGEITAGIAHEIQNPLNFVNNFSEVNTELIEEAEQKVNEGHIDGIKVILNDIKDNERKINHHGKRADAIVKGMLQHSRTNSGFKETTDINLLADEYLRLSYRGWRAKDKSFNATVQTDFDNSIGKIDIIPQDIGRVLLNLYNNAFYAVNEKRRHNIDAYDPAVSLTTKRTGRNVEVRVIDNGIGIPQMIADKIFQPFFTTKPTGEGTGLGLSLAYDIVKAHGGEIQVNSTEREFTQFVIVLPI